jgi:hypothetical protein
MGPSSFKILVFSIFFVSSFYKVKAQNYQWAYNIGSTLGDHGKQNIP